jgi:hypothetical protein
MRARHSHYLQPNTKLFQTNTTFPCGARNINPHFFQGFNRRLRGRHGLNHPGFHGFSRKFAYGPIDLVAIIKRRYSKNVQGDRELNTANVIGIIKHVGCEG